MSVSSYNSHILSLSLFFVIIKSLTQAQILFSWPWHQEYICNPEDKTRNCSETYDPVCAHYPVYCFAPPCPQFTDFSNSCLACQSPIVDSFKYGQCLYSCSDYKIRLDSSCTGLAVYPVCGILAEGCNQKDCQKSFRNYCEACYRGSVEFFAFGLCIGDKVLKCEPDLMIRNCSEELTDPICGLYQDSCEAPECRKTFINSCAACKDPNIVSYFPGSCPDDDKIYCNVSDRPISCQNVGSYIQVCGYSKFDCGNQSCRATYNSPCEACSDSHSLFYVVGACPHDEQY